MKDRPRSREAFRLAQELLPGGVNSPVRAFGAVGGDPPVIDRGSGAFIYDLDGNRYADYVCAYGPMILGHAHPAVVAAIRDAAAAGMAFGAPTKLETELAQRVVGAVPSIDQVRFVNSGTEATMTAIRLARGHTGRNKVVKFAGGYHGHADGLLAKAGSGVATLGLPDSAGVPAGYAAETLVARYNDLENVAQIVSAYGDDLAAVIVEPVAANMGVVPPASGFLEGLRDPHAWCRGAAHLRRSDHRLSGPARRRSGALRRNSRPHLPGQDYRRRAADRGRWAVPRRSWSSLPRSAPFTRRARSRGTPWRWRPASRHWTRCSSPGSMRHWSARGARLESAVVAAARRSGIEVAVSRVGSLLTVFFRAAPPDDLEGAQASDTKAYARFFHAALDAG